MIELSKLEQEIRNKMVSYNLTANNNSIEFYAKAAAELCRKKIELAFDAGYDDGFFAGNVPHTDTAKHNKICKDQWIKDNI